MKTEKMKDYVILGLLALLLISGGLNIYQNKVRKNAEIAAELDQANSNTLIAGKKAEIIMRDSVVKAIQKNRAVARVKDSIEIRGLKTRVVGLRQKLAELGENTPQEEADTTCARLIQVSALKDSVIERQDELISTLELTHSAEVIDLQAIIKEMGHQVLAQGQISNTLQNQLVEEKKNTRREVRKRKVWRFLAGVGIATAGVLAVMSQEK